MRVDAAKVSYYADIVDEQDKRVLPDFTVLNDLGRACGADGPGGEADAQ